jgi:hypothetical protein
MKRQLAALLCICVSGLPWIGCGDSSEEPVERSFLIVVESSLREPLRDSLEQYAETMQLAYFDVYVEPWVSGTVDDLKALLFDYVDRYGIEGALLIGEGLPAAWYEQEGFYDGIEKFPTDLYLQDRDALWIDQNDNQVPDYHSDLHLDIYTSRLMGTAAQLQDYFARVEQYRRIGPLTDVSAFIFMDNDWCEKDTSDECGLGELFSRVDILKDEADSTFDNYLTRLTGEGAEYVYQWIHAAPGWLQFDDLNDDGELIRIKLLAKSVPDYHLKVSFLNMANCYAARFTDAEESLAWAFTVGSEYGLASIGSTKIGAQTDPRLFHAALAEGLRWGEAYKMWFNAKGSEDDLWHLGVVLMGDPLLRVTGDLFPKDVSVDMTGDFLDNAEPPVPCCVIGVEPGTFEEYRRRHPEFFDDGLLRFVDGYLD